MSSANSIKVVARFRPQNRVEIESGGQPIVKFDGDDTCTVDVCAICPLSKYAHQDVENRVKHRQGRLYSSATGWLTQSNSGNL